MVGIICLTTDWLSKFDEITIIDMIMIIIFGSILGFFAIITLTRLPDKVIYTKKKKRKW